MIAILGDDIIEDDLGWARSEDGDGKPRRDVDVFQKFFPFYRPAEQVTNGFMRGVMRNMQACILLTWKGLLGGEDENRRPD